MAKHDKRTHQEYLVLLEGTNVFPLENYKTNTTRTKHICSCGNKNWYTYPCHILKGIRCSECEYQNIEKRYQGKYTQRLKEFNPKIILLGKVLNGRTKSQHRCECGNEDWYICPDNVFRGKKCNICRATEKEKKEEIKRTERESIFIKDLKIKNPLISLIGKFINQRTKTLFKCICGNPWDTLPEVTLRGGKCNDCGSRIGGQKRHLSLDEYKERLKKQNNPLIPLEAPKAGDAKILHECPCGIKFKTCPQYTLYEKNLDSCPDCSGGGFNVLKPASFYLYRLCSEKKEVIKIGISNRNVHKRAKGVIKSGRNLGSILTYFLSTEIFFPVGEDAKNLEKQIKADFKSFKDPIIPYIEGRDEMYPVYKTGDILIRIFRVLSSYRQLGIKFEVRKGNFNFDESDIL